MTEDEEIAIALGIQLDHMCGFFNRLETVEDLFIMNFLRHLAGGDNFRDPQIIKRARERRQDQ